MLKDTKAEWQRMSTVLKVKQRTVGVFVWLIMVIAPILYFVFDAVLFFKHWEE
jgi:hypothetical protein